MLYAPCFGSEGFRYRLLLWVGYTLTNRLVFFLRCKLKTFATSTCQPMFKGINKGKNNLEIFEINNSNLKINDSTMEYWRGLAIPVFLFAIAEDLDVKMMTLYYKRYTPILTATSLHSDWLLWWILQASDGHHFLAYANNEAKSFGFARDLFIDYMRCTILESSISYFSPRTIGLEQFPEEDAFFGELFEDYRENICTMYDKTRTVLERLCVDYRGRLSAPEPFSRTKWRGAWRMIPAVGFQFRIFPWNFGQITSYCCL